MRPLSRRVYTTPCNGRKGSRYADLDRVTGGAVTRGEIAGELPPLEVASCCRRLRGREPRGSTRTKVPLSKLDRIGARREQGMRG